MRWASVLSSALLVAGASAVPHLYKNNKNLAAASSTAVPAPTGGASYWLADVKHQGNAPYADSGYKVFRNVKDYGAAGDGSTDDTDAINKAISDGSRASPASNTTSSTTPAIVYFPPGTYVVSAPIIDYYFTQIIGNPNDPATIKPTSSFKGIGVIDGDQYQNNGKEGWISTNIFLRQVRNLIIDLTDIPGTTAATGIHWPTSQATSLQNVVINCNADAGSQHQGIFIEDGSGGFMSDVTVNGGLYGMNIGNQQFTFRNITINNAATAISQIWDWGWTYVGLNINNATTGINFVGGTTGQAVGGANIIDSTISNVKTFVNTTWTSDATPAGAGNLILENVVLDSVTTAVQGPSETYLKGGSSTIASFGQGHQYTPSGPNTLQGTYAPIARPSGLTTGSGSNYFTKSKPQYENVPASQVVSIRDAGAKGDGKTDDTKAINSALSSASSNGTIVFFDYGIYLVTDTIYFPPGVKVVGESYPIIAGSGDAFSDASNPLPVVQVGKSGDKGTIEWSDFRVGTIGGAAGAIAIEWNLNGDQGAGMWDVHTLIGGWTGSSLQVKDCPTSASVSASCQAAFMSVHITKDAQNFYSENNWFWTADHDIDDPTNTRVSIYTGRGVLVEASNVIMWGTGAEHHGLYQFQFHGASNVVGGYFQTESPYYQPSPDATAGPYKSNTTWNDPDFSTCLSGNCDALGLRVTDSSSLSLYGTGLYSFFNNYDTSCSNSGGSENCQSEIFRVDGSVSNLNVYGYNTVGVTNMITVNGTGAAKYSDNLSVYPDSIALFSV
ncbi:putative glucan 1,3-beta-glucosidase precursor [Talaromyces proteolyticus]|uniref:Glucan 1,3-beta-glucosidase n=1 Tax=Talaromyces proteolyticus TaxID=1131652 RepID=A0AAD4L1Q6_9EURO|nr:putative glucan 1,3-beta-glucosidase precursor [Talaromyces proteolyticus]KAH8701624.1 putative glucan 1,3-beta-glucosidase precursor [Talaromyces proteolyticus]